MKLTRRELLLLFGAGIILLVLIPTLYLARTQQNLKGQAEQTEKPVEDYSLLGASPNPLEENFYFQALTPQFTPDTLIVKYKDVSVAQAPTAMEVGVKGREPLYPSAQDPKVAVERNRQRFPERAKGAPREAKIPDLRTIYRIRVAPEDVEVARERFSSDPQVEWVKREEIKRPAVIPNDPYYSYQWYLPKIGLSEVGNNNSGWDIQRGSDQVIVVTGDWCGDYDRTPSGYDTSHPDLQNRVPENSQFTSSGICAGGHETLVAGIIGANTNNNLGIAGENWKVKVIAAGGENAILEAIDDWGARIVSVSWNPISWELTEYAYALNALMVWAAGNENKQVGYETLEKCNHSLVVAATDQNDRKASFSNWGDCVSISAPGTSILSTLPTALAGLGLWASEGPLSLAVSPQAGLPRVVYYEPYDKRLKFASFDGGSWSEEIVDESGNAGQYVSLQIDNLGRPHLTYLDFAHNELKYAIKESGWLKETIDLGGKYSVLKLDANGNPNVAYYKGNQLIFARKEGGLWQKEVVDGNGNVGGYPSLAIALNGTVGISYYDFTGRSLKYAAKIRGSWQIEVVHSGDSSTSIGWGSSLVFGSENLPRISYLGNGSVPGASYRYSNFLYYVAKTQTGWEKELIEGGYTGLFEGVSSVFTFYFGREPSLILDENGRPKIAILRTKYVYTSPSSYFPRLIEEDFRILEKTGSWSVNSIVASTSTSGYLTSPYSQYPGFQNDYFYSPSRQFVLYKMKNGDLMFGLREGGGWRVSKVGEIKNPYSYSSGTSFATPVVAGAAALVFAQHPEDNVDQIRQALLDGVDDLVQENVPVRDAWGNPITINCGTGKDPCFGTGRLNIRKTLELIGPPTGISTISGQVRLQTRNIFAGVTVTIDGQTTTTNDQGYFEQAVAGTGGVYRILAKHPGFLEKVAEGVLVGPGQTVDLGITTLLAGDANGDNKIDIFDLVAVGANYGKRTSEVILPPGWVVDFNNDGKIDIFDLVAVGANYGQRGPKPWR